MSRCDFTEVLWNFNFIDQDDSFEEKELQLKQISDLFQDMRWAAIIDDIDSSRIWMSHWHIAEKRAV